MDRAADSKVITVHYQVKVGVSICGLDPKVKMHITMGTVPYLRTDEHPVQYGTPVGDGTAVDDEQGPSTRCIDTFGALPLQNASSYPDFPPPSYSEVMGESPVNNRKKNDAQGGKHKHQLGRSGNTENEILVNREERFKHLSEVLHEKY